METDEKIFNVLISLANQLTGYFYQQHDGAPSHKGIPGVIDKLDQICSKLDEISQKLDHRP